MKKEERVSFFKEHFDNEEECENFIARCEELDHENDTAKIIMHQTQRLVSLADDITEIRPNRPSLQILFLIICAENISKLNDNFNEEGQMNDPAASREVSQVRA